MSAAEAVGAGGPPLSSSSDLEHKDGGKPNARKNKKGKKEPVMKGEVKEDAEKAEGPYGAKKGQQKVKKDREKAPAGIRPKGNQGKEDNALVKGASSASEVAKEEATSKPDDESAIASKGPKQKKKDKFKGAKEGDVEVHEKETFKQKKYDKKKEDKSIEKESLAEGEAVSKVTHTDNNRPQEKGHGDASAQDPKKKKNKKGKKDEHKTGEKESEVAPTAVTVSEMLDESPVKDPERAVASKKKKDKKKDEGKDAENEGVAKMDSEKEKEKEKELEKDKEEEKAEREAAKEKTRSKAKRTQKKTDYMLKERDDIPPPAAPAQVPATAPAPAPAPAPTPTPTPTPTPVCAPTTAPRKGGKSAPLPATRMINGKPTRVINGRETMIVTPGTGGGSSAPPKAPVGVPSSASANQDSISAGNGGSGCGESSVDTSMNDIPPLRRMAMEAERKAQEERLMGRSHGSSNNNYRDRDRGGGYGNPRDHNSRGNYQDNYNRGYNARDSYSGGYGREAAGYAATAQQDYGESSYYHHQQQQQQEILPIQIRQSDYTAGNGGGSGYVGGYSEQPRQQQSYGGGMGGYEDQEQYSVRREQETIRERVGGYSMPPGPPVDPYQGQRAQRQQQQPGMEYLLGGGDTDYGLFPGDTSLPPPGIPSPPGPGYKSAMKMGPPTLAAHLSGNGVTQAQTSSYGYMDMDDPQTVADPSALSSWGQQTTSSVLNYNAASFTPGGAGAYR